jgi:hypothetical protein
LKRHIDKLTVLFLVVTVGLAYIVKFQQSAYALTSHDLGITPKLERKDTYMLCLEGCPLYGPNAWDKPHENVSNHSSTRGMGAVISMVASYYGGNLSQDRIAYYVYAEYSNDTVPEDDLGHGRGLIGLNIVFILRWALNDAAVVRMTGKPDFEDIKYRLDKNSPIIRDDGTTEHRITLIDGYTIDEEGEFVHVIDPLTGTESKILYENLSVFVVWYPYVYDGVITARSDEPTIWMDSDGDGIVDFDEINRFHTNPYNPDTDGDGIDDKTEIRSYTFLSNDAFDSKDIRKPDADGDGLRAELDYDSDGGGVPDGLEDLNHNGKVDQGETDPLNPSDDTQNSNPPPNDFGWLIPWIILILSLAVTTTSIIIYLKHKRQKQKLHKHKSASLKPKSH